MRLTATSVLFDSGSAPSRASRRPAPRRASARKERWLALLPYISLTILATVMLGAFASRMLGVLTDNRPFPGLSQNAAIQRGGEICQALSGGSASAVSICPVSTIDPKRNARHNDWEITYQGSRGVYLMKIDATQNRLLHFQKQPDDGKARPVEQDGRAEIDDAPERLDRAHAIQAAQQYLKLAGLTAKDSPIAIRTASSNVNNQLWNIVCDYTDPKGERRIARVGLRARSGELDYLHAW